MQFLSERMLNLFSILILCSEIWWCIRYHKRKYQFYNATIKVSKPEMNNCEDCEDGTFSGKSARTALSLCVLLSQPLGPLVSNGSSLMETHQLYVFLPISHSRARTSCRLSSLVSTRSKTVPDTQQTIHVRFCFNSVVIFLLLLVAVVKFFWPLCLLTL